VAQAAWEQRCPVSRPYSHGHFVGERGELIDVASRLQQLSGAT
jgi:hypothetical protein